MVTAFVTAGAGFLLAVLWFDLMFDVQVLRAERRDEGVASIAAYYRRVTLEAYPMNRLVAVVMLGTVAALIAQVADGDAPRWASGISLALTLGATGLAAAHTFGNGARLGTRTGTPFERAGSARAADAARPRVCLAAIVTVLVLELGFAR